MPKSVSKQSLVRQMAAHFPDRWEIARIDSRVEGDKVIGAVKIHCNQDDKTFLSDFSAKLDSKGRIADLTLDGVHVGKFIGRLHE